MAYVADLHIHSRFSRACSSQINVPNLAKWARWKGVDLIGTGDFLHPLWKNELKANLEDLGNGLFQFDGIKFLLTNEISCIYTDKGKSRRIHLVVCLPSLSSLENLSQEFLKRRVNIASDGRPIIGWSATQLCETVWGVEPKALIIPAHIWTPWFSLFGSQSGYDFLSECFGEFSDQIYAVETGLSSEPAMNWRIAELDNKSIVSFSDAHSLPNLGREATIFKGNLSYDELVDDLKKQNLVGTIEFFPEEGKYHYSGHRNCQVVYGPDELKQKGTVCPVCGKKLTVGVMQRVEDLATRSEAELELVREDGIIRSKKFPNRPGFKMLVQLDTIIAEALNSTSKSLKVQNEYDKLIGNLGAELWILTKAPIDKISSISGPKIAEGVQRVRESKLSIIPGYDNTYGVVKIWGDEGGKGTKQIGLF